MRPLGHRHRRDRRPRGPGVGPRAEVTGLGGRDRQAPLRRALGGAREQHPDAEEAVLVEVVVGDRRHLGARGAGPEVPVDDLGARVGRERRGGAGVGPVRQRQGRGGQAGAVDDDVRGRRRDPRRGRTRRRGRPAAGGRGRARRGGAWTPEDSPAEILPPVDFVVDNGVALSAILLGVVVLAALAVLALAGLRLWRRTRAAQKRIEPRERGAHRPDRPAVGGPRGHARAPGRAPGRDRVAAGAHRGAPGAGAERATRRSRPCAPRCATSAG